MEFEGKKGAVAGTASLGSRAAHDGQHFLKPRAANCQLNPCKIRQTLRSIRKCGRNPSRQSLAFFEPDLQLYPDSQRMFPELIVP
jgi:hypothetical protein